jgi:hypothetical protein
MKRKGIDYLIALLIAALASLMSYGIFSIFGFTDYKLLRKVYFFLVLLFQWYLPIVVLLKIYGGINQAENDFFDAIKAKQDAAKTP